MPTAFHAIEGRVFAGQQDKAALTRYMKLFHKTGLAVAALWTSGFKSSLEKFRCKRKSLYVMGLPFYQEYMRLFLLKVRFSFKTTFWHLRLHIFTFLNMTRI
jgi:hypothetical protein